MKRFSLFICLVILLLVVAVIPATASPTISSISPAAAPNDGDVTVTITGTGFNSNSTVMLISGYDYDYRIYGTIVSWSPTSITCTFAIQGRTPAQYFVYVNSPFISRVNNNLLEDVGVLNSGFRISQGTGLNATTTTTPVPTLGNSQSLFATLTATPATTTATTKIPEIYIVDTTPVATARTTTSPIGIEIGIIATVCAALLGMKRK